MIRPSSTCLGLAAMAFATAVPVAAHAQDDMVRVSLESMRVPVAAPGGLADLFRGSPGSSAGTPSAFGPGMGDFFVGGGYQSTMRGIKQANGTFTENDLDDAAVSAGFGLGDPTNGIGFSTVITALSLRSGFANSTAFSFQAFRKINPTLAVAVGVENAIISGGENTEGADSWYGVASKVFQQPAADVAWLKSVTVSAGFGNGRFRTADDISIGNETVMVFASVSATVHDQVSVIGEFTGQDVNLGLSVVPVRKFPVAITMALADLTGAASESARLIIGAGLVVRY